MKVKDLFEKWQLTSIKGKFAFLEMEFQPSDVDKDAAWELYIELLTRVALRPLDDASGNEKSSLESIYSIFPTTRNIIRKYGRESIEFSKVAVTILNQIIRPFTTKWHTRIDNIKDEWLNKEFREDLIMLQKNLTNYARMLADIAGVEDLTELEEE